MLFASLMATDPFVDHSHSYNPINVKEITLSNGLTVWLNEDHSTSKVFGSVVVKAGAKDSPNTGIAHYFEHIMFKGTNKIGTIDYAKENPLLDEIRDKYDLLSQTQQETERLEIQKQINELSLKAAQYAIPNDFNTLISKYGGNGLNAGTSYDYTVYYNYFSPQYLEQWCILNSERIIHPVFRLFQSELETVYEEKNMYEDRLGNSAMQAILRRITAPHPYQYPIIGSTENLKNPRLSDMDTFFRQYYVAGNMGLILAGDFNSNEIIPLLEKTFGQIRPGEAPKQQFPQPAAFQGEESLKVKFPIPFVSAAAMCWHTVPNSHPDALGVNVMARMLSNSGKTGLLDKLMLGGTMMTAAGLEMSLNDLGVFAVFAIPRPPFGTHSKALKTLKQVVQQLKDGTFSDTHFAQIKNEILREHMLNIETLETRSQLFISLFAQGKSWKHVAEEVEQLQKLTKQDIVELAQKYLTNNCLVIKKVTGKYPKEKIQKPPFKAIVPPAHGKESPLALELKQIKPQTIKPKVIDLASEAEPTHLGSKGLAHLYYTPNATNDIFTLNLTVHYGHGSKPELKYLADFLDFSSPEGVSVEEYNQTLQAIGAALTFRSSPDSFTFSLSGFNSHFKESLQLLAQLLYNADGDEKGMKQIRSAKKLANKAIRKETDQLSKYLFDYARFGKQAPHLQDLTTKKLSKTTGQTLLLCLKELLATETDIHYIGNTPHKEVVEALQEHLRLNDILQPGRVLTVKESQPVNNTQILLVNDANATQSVIRIAIPMHGLTPKEKNVLEMLCTYIGGGMNSLLFQEIREFRSLAYGVYAQPYILPPVCNSDAGEMDIYLSTQADKTLDALNTLMSLLQTELADAKRTELAATTLKNSTLQMYPEFRKYSARIAMLRRQGYTQDPAQTRIQIANETTPQDLKTFTQQHLQKSPILITIVGNTKRIGIDKLAQIAPVTTVKTKEFLLD